MGEYLDKWEMVLSGMRNPPAENVLEDLLYGKIHRLDGLAEDIAHYNRLDDDAGGDRSYEFLLSSAQRCANRERQKNMREQMSRALPEPLEGRPCCRRCRPRGDPGSARCGRCRRRNRQW